MENHWIVYLLGGLLSWAVIFVIALGIYKLWYHGAIIPEWFYKRALIRSLIAAILLDIEMLIANS